VHFAVLKKECDLSSTNGILSPKIVSGVIAGRNGVSQLPVIFFYPVIFFNPHGNKSYVLAVGFL
jgi:hypothetical protein